VQGVGTDPPPAVEGVEQVAGRGRDRLPAEVQVQHYEPGSLDSPDDPPQVVAVLVRLGRRRLPYLRRLDRRDGGDRTIVQEEPHPGLQSLYRHDEPAVQRDEPADLETVVDLGLAELFGEHVVHRDAGDGRRSARREPSRWLPWRRGEQGHPFAIYSARRRHGGVLVAAAVQAALFVLPTAAAWARVVPAEASPVHDAPSCCFSAAERPSSAAAGAE